LKKPLFNKWDLQPWKVPASLHWDLLTSGRYHPSVSLFLKSEKKALLYVGKGPKYMPFAIFNCSFSLLALGTDLKSQKGLYSGPFSYTNNR
jgi:hypothetical protein